MRVDRAASSALNSSTYDNYALVLSVAGSLAGFNLTSRADDNTGAAATSQSVAKADKKTTKFLKEASKDNQAEVALAELGLQKTQNSELKQLCEHMQKDHSEVAQQLQPIAAKYGISTEQAKEHKEVARLQKLSGVAFDREFAELLLKQHQKDIERFQQASTEIKEPDVKQFAQTILPKLHQHFNHAETVARAVGVDNNTITSLSRKVNTAMGGTSDPSSRSTGSSTLDTDPNSSTPAQSDFRNPSGASSE